MKVKDLIHDLKELDPEAEVRFFKFEEGFFGEYERIQIFVEDISASQESVEILLG
jgi:hypothetical protein